MEKLSPIANRKRIQLFGVEIDSVTMVESVQLVFNWIAQKERICRFIVTPNVDHIVKLQHNTGLKRAYEKASLIVTDGRPVVWAASMLGEHIPEVVTGSDLVPSIFDFAHHHQIPIRVYLLGAMPGVAEHAKSMILARWTCVEVVGTHSPAFGFEKDADQCQSIIASINESQADVLVIGLGAPKQELWVTQFAPQLSVKVALCVGATIDFIAGEKARPPVWVRKIGMEWMHRMLSEPKRLGKRYFIDAVEFPVIVLKEWRLRKSRT
jgi:N-acetylglucosaminyldiphosphoundecaprenol N-acetyl-beta-D-mannosaminyltransferase